MNVENVHERVLPRPIAEVAPLLDSLASPGDRLWPRRSWPAMKLDRPLGLGAAGGHGPVRYFVSAFESGRSVTFTFAGPPGFDGFHRFEVIERSPVETVLRHTLRMKARGRALLTWPFVFRPLHDALLEDLLDRAAAELGVPPARSARWSAGVVVLRHLLRRPKR